MMMMEHNHHSDDRKESCRLCVLVSVDVLRYNPRSLKENVEEIIVASAENVHPSRRTRVMLPSGNVLSCAIVALFQMLPLLKERVMELRDGLVTFDFQPGSAFTDDIVIDFFENIHRSWTNEPYYLCNHTVQFAMVHAMQVPGAFGLATDAFNLWRADQLNLSLGVLEFCGDKSKARQAFLAMLKQLPTEQFRGFFHKDNWPILLETFTPKELLQLANSRHVPAKHRADTMPPGPATPMDGRVVMKTVANLPSDFQMEVVISPSFSIVCDAELMELQSSFIRDYPRDLRSEVYAVELPIAASFDPLEVHDFFQHISKHKDGNAFWWPQWASSFAATEWPSFRLSWVHLADFLQMPTICDELAAWLWQRVQHEHLWDWIAATRLQSMQQRRPEHVRNTLDLSDLEEIAGNAPDSECKSPLMRLVQNSPHQFMSALGAQQLLELLHTSSL